MTLLLVSFLAGVLTILAPCVLPLLPIILGAGVENPNDKYRPYIIISSLIFSIVIFSLLLKATTTFIGVDPLFWKLFSGGILVGFGIITMFPDLWKNFSTKIGFAGNSNTKLASATQKKGILGNILVGFSLGPVFSSCSPTYAIILAVILPISFVSGIINLFAYSLGLGVMLLLISLLGQKFAGKLRGLSDPKSIFKKILAVIFILVGIAIISGYDKKIEAKILESGYFDVTEIEQSILDKVGIDDESLQEDFENNKGNSKKKL